jgi:Uma2 family endonuclease
MAVVDSPQGKAKDLRTRIEALRPGDVFSIDRPITVEEFCEYVPDEGSAELVNGVIYVMSPPTDPHEALGMWLGRVLGLYIELRGLGEVRGSRSGVLINRTSLREPDLLFFRKERLDQMTTRGVHGAPDLAIEIVDSPKARREAVGKQAQYEAIGVAELWVIDLPRKEVRQFAFAEDELRPVAPETEGEIASRVVEGFHLQTAWLFIGPAFPSSLEVVQNLWAA